MTLRRGGLLRFGAFACLALFGCAVSRDEAEPFAPDAEARELDNADASDETSPPAKDASPGADAAASPDANDALVPVDNRGDAGTSSDDDAGSPAQCASPGEPPSRPTQLGAPNEPYEHELAAGALAATLDWRGRAFIRVTGLSPGQRYAVVALGSELELATFEAEPAFTFASCQAILSAWFRPAACFVTAAATTLDLTLHTARIAQPFELELRPIGPAAGTPQAPLALALADLPRELEASPEGTSYYEITGLSSATPYAVRGLAPSGPVELNVYAATGFAGAFDPQYAASGAIGVPTGGSLYVSLLGPPTGERVTLDVRPAHAASEGSRDQPHVLDVANGLPYGGWVGWAYHVQSEQGTALPHSESVYAFTGLTPGDHFFSVSGAEGLELAVHDALEDAATCRARVGTVGAQTSAECVARVGGSTAFVVVRNRGGDGSRIDLYATPHERSSEGTAGAPVALTLDELPYAGAVQPLIASHYRIEALRPGAAYWLELTDASLRAHVEVHDAASGERLCATNTTLAGATYCEIAADSSAVLVTVQASSTNEVRNVGGAFELRMRALSAAQVGTRDEPIEVECFDGSFEAAVGPSGYGYYRLTGLEPGVLHIITAEQRSVQVELQVARPDAPPLSRDRCDALGSELHPAYCLAPASDGTLLVQLYSEARGEPITLHVRKPHAGSYGEAGAPFTVDATELPHATQIATAAPSYLALEGLTPGAQYTLRVAVTHESVMVERFDDASFAETSDDLFFYAEPGEPYEQPFTADGEAAYVQLTLMGPSDWYTDAVIELVASD